MFIRQATSGTIRIGPFLDSADGVTEETALGLASTDIQISKNGAAFANKNDTTAPSHDSDGWYSCVLNSTDTNTVGKLIVKSHDNTVHLPVWHEFYIVEESIYDSLFAASAAGFDANQRVDVGQWLGNVVTFGTGGPDVNVNAISDDTGAASNLALDYDGTGYNKANSTVGTVTTVDTLSINAIPSGVLQTAAQQQLADTILSRGVENVEDTADKNSLTRVVLSTQGWETVGATGVRIKKTDGTEFAISAISGDADASLIVTLG